jgi:hypothetical protein
LYMFSIDHGVLHFMLLLGLNHNWELN